MAQQAITHAHVKQSESEDLFVADFVEKYAHKLPLAVVVTTGYHGESSQATISAFDRLNVHFVKKNKVIISRLQEREFRIPINSALEFSLVYNPNNNIEQAKKGFIFTTVSDICKAKAPPKLVCCMKAWRNKDFSIAEKEVLIIFPNICHKKACNLKVYSILSSKEMYLPLDCEGHFTTSISKVHLYLQEIENLIPDPFPCQVCIYMHKTGVQEILQNMPHYLSLEVLTLIGTTVETSLIASSAFSEAQTHLIEIPVNIPEVKVTIMQNSDTNVDQELYAKTCYVFHNYNPKAVQSIKEATSREEYSVQSLFYSSIRKGYETSGIESDYDYIEPPKIASSKGNMGLNSHLMAAQLNDRDVNADNYGHLSHSITNSLTLPPRTRNTKTLQKAAPTLCKQASCSVLKLHTSANEQNPNLENHSTIHSSHTAEQKQPYHHFLQSTMIKDSSISVQQLQHSYDNLLETLVEMEREIKKLNNRVKKLEAASGITEPSEQDSTERNLQYISTLTCEQIIELLTTMGLSQYVNIFMKERINGQIFLELDEKMLIEKLGITTKLHCARLLKVIQGRHSAKNILLEKNPYDTTT